MRVSLTEKEIHALVDVLKGRECSVCSEILHKLQREKSKPTHPNKIKAVEKARRSRAAMTRKKVENAINMLRLYGDEISFENIAKEAGVSMASAKKYGTLVQRA